VERERQRVLLVLAASIFLGLTLLMSGIGKVPGQTEFIDVLLQFIWTPALAYLVGYCLPWVEIVLGAALLVGVFPRIAAALCLPLTIGFMASNAWAISQGIEQFPACAYCFGKWEEMFGAMSPVQSLSLDIVLFALALIILLFYPGSFFSFRTWFSKIKGEKS